MSSLDKLMVGMVRHGRHEKPLFLPMPTIGRHTVMCGPTGVGKSAELTALWSQLAIRDQVGLVVVDVKGELAANLRDEFLPVLGSNKSCIGYMR